MSVVFFVSLSLIIWLFLLLFWGGFWRANQRIDSSKGELEAYPTVWAVVPARDEADVISVSLTSLLNQDYLGELEVVLVDDNSRDRTSEIAKQTAAKLGKKLIYYFWKTFG